jgi:hypothetical protein
MTHSSFDASPGLVIWHSRDLVKHEGRYYIYIPFMAAPWSKGLESATPDEAARARFEDGSLLLAAKGTGSHDCSPLTRLVGDRAYEFSVQAEIIGGAEAGLLARAGSGREDAVPEYHQRSPHRFVPLKRGWRALDAARGAQRNLRLPRQHDRRHGEPAPGAVRGRQGRCTVPRLQVPRPRMR